MLRLFAASLLLLTACATTGARDPSIGPQPIPERLQAEVERAKLLGRAIWENDVISAAATDVLLEAKVLPGDERVRGWVTTQDAEGAYAVQFVTALRDGQLAATHEVRFEPRSAEVQQVDEFGGPRPLAADAEAMFRARTTALGQVKTACGSGLNPVVLPASLIGQEGWLVYVLAGTNRRGETVLAGHRLFRVSAEGRSLLGEVALSRSCLVQPPPRRGEPVGLFLNHIVSDAPMETHVFTSLLNRMTLFVVTSAGMWQVNGVEISFQGAR